MTQSSNSQHLVGRWALHSLSFTFSLLMVGAATVPLNLGPVTVVGKQDCPRDAQQAEDPSASTSQCKWPRPRVETLPSDSHTLHWQKKKDCNIMGKNEQKQPPKKSPKLPFDLRKSPEDRTRSSLLQAILTRTRLPPAWLLWSQSCRCERGL